MKRLLVLVGVFSCAAGPHDAPRPRLEPYSLVVVNEATVAARVEDSYSTRAVRVYGSFESLLWLNESTGERFLTVEVGSFVYRTPRFWPNDTAPRWYLIVKQPPRLPEGPWPCLSERCP